MSELVAELRAYQRWMKYGIDGEPSIGIDDINGDETFGAAADLIEAQAAQLQEAREELAAWRARFPGCGFNGKIIVMCG